MRRLLPAAGAGTGEPVSDLDAHYQVPRRDWLRANFIASADGAISFQGQSRALQVPADLRVFAVLRGLADAVLVGAGTARAERYHPARPSALRRAQRVAAGLSPVPPIVVVSSSGDPGLPPEFYEHAASAPVVIAPQQTARPIEGARVVACGESTVDLGRIRAVLAGLGLRQLVCEGGPTLLAGLAAAGQLDELCLTVSPLLAGPGPGRLLAGPAWAAALPLRLTHLLEEEGALLARYEVGRRQPPYGAAPPGSFAGVAAPGSFPGVAAPGSSASASSTFAAAPTPAGSPSSEPAEGWPGRKSSAVRPWEGPGECGGSGGVMA